jgi:hypothetical protein
VEDLATYSSVLQKPLVPEPLAGGAVVNWSGEGSAERYSGRFFARLQKVRSLGKTGAQLHPVNAELEASYAPGALQFSRFSVSDNNSSFSARVQLGKQSVSLSEIQLKQGMETRLEGDAVLPLDVWSAWPNGATAQLLAENGPVQFKLNAKNLRLGEALRLSGWNWPLDGGVTGQIWGSGAGPKLDLGGQLKLIEGKLPLGWNGDVLSNVSADITLAGPKVVLGNSLLNHASGQYGTHGEIDLQNLRDPVLNLALQCSQAEAKLLPDWKLPSPLGLTPFSKRLGLKAISALELQLRGPASKSTITGEVRVRELATEEPLDLQPLWSWSGPPPAFFAWGNEPWSGCKLDLHCTFVPFDDNNPGSQRWAGDLKITGTGAAPELAGRVAVGQFDPATGAWTEDLRADWSQLFVKSNGVPLRVTSGSATFKPGTPIDPTVDFAFAGTLHALPFHASIVGPLSHHIAFVDSDEARQILLGLSPGAALGVTGKPDPSPVLLPAKPLETPGATPAPARAATPAPGPAAPPRPAPQGPVAAVPAPAPAVSTSQAKP